MPPTSVPPIKIIASAFRKGALLYDATVSTVAGIEIINISPMYAKMLGTCVLTVTAAAVPNVNRKPKVMNVADFARADDAIQRIEKFRHVISACGRTVKLHDVKTVGFEIL